MEVPQGNSLCSYVEQPKMTSFSSFLIQNHRTGRKNRVCGLVSEGVGRSGEMMKEVYDANTVYTRM
jgi:hypothetical protein